MGVLSVFEFVWDGRIPDASNLAQDPHSRLEYYLEAFKTTDKGHRYIDSMIQMVVIVSGL